MYVHTNWHLHEHNPYDRMKDEFGSCQSARVLYSLIKIQEKRNQPSLIKEVSLCMTIWKLSTAQLKRNHKKENFGRLVPTIFTWQDQARVEPLFHDLKTYWDSPNEQIRPMHFACGHLSQMQRVISHAMHAVAMLLKMMHALFFRKIYAAVTEDTAGDRQLTKVHFFCFYDMRCTMHRMGATM
jgi:hypothetical protein